MENEDTKPDEGVSLEDVANLLGDEQEPTEEAEEQADEEIQPEGEDQAEEAEDEGYAEVEFEGKTYKVPNELKTAIIHQADYTRKTQEVAEQRKAVQAQTELLQKQQEMLAQSFDKAVEFRDVQNRLSQFEKLDWQALVDQDPVQATKLNIAYQQTQREAQTKYGELMQSQAQTQQLSDEHRQQVLIEARKELNKRLPDFTPQTAEKIKTTAREYGITDAEINSLTDPRFVHILHDATKWRALQAEKPKAMKKVDEAPKVLKPQASQPRKQPNQAAYDRLKKNGRVEDLAALL